MTVDGVVGWGGVEGDSLLEGAFSRGGGRCGRKTPGAARILTNSCRGRVVSLLDLIEGTVSDLNVFLDFQ